jgi:hypothetical protein
MSNFTDFFPAAGGGGGGFTKQNKYSTFFSNDADYKSGPAISASAQENKTAGANNMLFNYAGGSSTDSFTNVTNSMVGYTFTHNSTLHTITANPAFSNGYDVRFTFTPVLTASLNYNTVVSFTPPQLIVNPATDLGLEDGSQIGYMLVGAGYSSPDGNYGGRGGKIIFGTATIVTASTDLIFTPGVANGGSSTISGGGLALSSGDGSNAAGFSDLNISNSVVFTAGSGNMGYGAGGGRYNGSRNSGTNYHGYGVGAFTTGTGGDGAILLFY